MSNNKKHLLTNRRNFLGMLGQTATTIYFSPELLSSGSLLFAQGQRRHKFVMYIHAGSWDGWTSGLLQSNDTVTRNGRLEALWQRGIFVVGQENTSLNPNVNAAFRHNNLIFNSYSKLLLPIADNMTFAAGNARSAGHEKAGYFQSTGGDDNSQTASWIAGAAQMLSPDSSSLIVSPSANAASKRSANTSKVSLIEAFNAEGFAKNLSDMSAVPKSDMASKFWDVSKSLIDQKLILGDIAQSERHGYRVFLDKLVSGVSGFSTGSELHTSISQKINLAAANQMIMNEIGAANDANGCVHTSFALSGLADKLHLAGMLAKSGLAHGMSFGLDGEDHHFGNAGDQTGSTIGTARRGAQLWAHMRLFWEWITEQGLQDDVLVIVSHDFTRSAYNSIIGAPVTIKANGADVSISVPGTDHSLTMGMVFLGGKVPCARVGVVGDHNSAKATSDLAGTVATGPAFTSDQIVGSMLMRVFDDVIKDFDTVKKVWPNMAKPISFLVD